MKFLIDMNLSPKWVEFLVNAGFDAIHWSSIGHPAAHDHVLMEWASQNNCIVFTHDLDFACLLALTQATKPSVLQVRAHHILPTLIGDIVIQSIQQFQKELQAGALLTVDAKKSRVRILPFMTVD